MRSIRFTFLLNDDERQQLRSMSQHLRRTQGDTVRLLIQLASEELNINKVLNCSITHSEKVKSGEKSSQSNISVMED
jgi:hypothetical protein